MSETKNKFAVIGAGSAGLVTLKTLSETFPDASVQGFEAGYSVRGRWGDQPESFISASTKYTTQFSCFRKFKAEATAYDDQNCPDFYRGKEFGDYLDSFAERFDLRRFINFGWKMKAIRHEGERWILNFSHDQAVTELEFDAVFICTGLASVSKLKDLQDAKPEICTNLEEVANKKVVVLGGGESASDSLMTLSNPARNNKVYLSLRSGMRVSPRYHPIKGVPSDYLRNRLLYSVSTDLRNIIGEKFVAFRIRHEKFLRKITSAKKKESSHDNLKRFWNLKLMSRARDELFSVHHNKDERFLEAVADGRVTIIGPAQDSTYTNFYDFDQKESLVIDPDVLVSARGFSSGLEEISAGLLHLRDFYLGCVHHKYKNIFLIGFTRPVIGNIPAISELQARYCAQILQGCIQLPLDIESKHIRDMKVQERLYSTIDLNNIYPVDMIPYCDRLAKAMGIYPSLLKLKSFKLWILTMLSPASLFHYLDENWSKESIQKTAVYMPLPAIILISVVKLFSPLLRVYFSFCKR